MHFACGKRFSNALAASVTETIAIYAMMICSIFQTVLASASAPVIVEVSSHQSNVSADLTGRLQSADGGSSSAVDGRFYIGVLF